ncbi:P1 family peptidase [Pikeienuella piscinae]|uniref:P1 family peptidase n=1 Tax=Pikeienuella piscinae TaxID=2748098 RepID=A0A7L5BT51_9RHOB|nr:P1 family peptidase [Pikeienuella piscinae]QIE55020.1 P1 family peptidase [Pikeienuella piscinae]
MKTARELGLIRDGLATGPLNAITDVAGVTVGRSDLRGAGVVTGVTAVIPYPGDIFRLKPRAAVEIINGFGKSAGLMQVAELGMIETPILLTNTFGVAPCVQALIRRAVTANPAIGRETSTVNALVCECNDGRINDIQALAVTEADVFAALDAARGGAVAQGAVGAGSGMTAFGFKAGIGTASRRLAVGDEAHVLGALVLANFGLPGDLTLPDGRRPDPGGHTTAERGSVIVVLATDLPLGDRQLQRVARRAGAGVARLGAFWGNGSGDIALCFTTADPVEHEPPAPFAAQRRLSDGLIDIAFRAAVEATQEAALNALCMAPATPGRDGRLFPALADWLKENPVR